MYWGLRNEGNEPHLMIFIKSQDYWFYVLFKRAYWVGGLRGGTPPGPLVDLPLIPLRLRLLTNTIFVLFMHAYGKWKSTIFGLAWLVKSGLGTHNIVDIQDSWEFRQLVGTCSNCHFCLTEQSIGDFYAGNASDHMAQDMWRHMNEESFNLCDIGHLEAHSLCIVPCMIIKLNWIGEECEISHQH